MPRDRRHGATWVLVGWALIIAFGFLWRGCAGPPVPTRSEHDAQLLQRVEELEAEIRTLTSQGVLRDRLKRDAPHFHAIPARLLPVPNLLPQRRAALINVGRADGVAPGHGVVARSGVVGRVERVHKNRSWVMLADDPEFRVLFTVAHRQASAVARGGGLPGQLLSILHDAPPDYEVGDLAITKGDAVFPRGILLGEIVERDVAGGRVFVQLSTDPGQTEVVAVLTLPAEIEPSTTPRQP